MCVKEFVAVLVQLVCFERLGVIDLFQGGLVLYMILVVFAFPFLNSYLFGFLRFGMWLKKSKKGKDAELGVWEWFGRTLIQFVLVTVSQVAGAVCAAELVGHINSTWGSVGMYKDYRGVNPPVEGNPKIGLSYLRPPESDIQDGYELFEEFCAVLLLLIGLLHLIACDSGGLLLNTYWYKDESLSQSTDEGGDGVGFTTSMDSVQSHLAGIRYTMDELKLRVDGLSLCDPSALQQSSTVVMANPQVVGNIVYGNENSMVQGDGNGLNGSGGGKPNPMKHVKPLPPIVRSGALPPVAGATQAAPADLISANPFASAFNTDSLFARTNVGAALPLNAAIPKKQPASPIIPIPSALILHASILVAALTRAFPSAHQSLHLTVYYWQMNYFTDASTLIERIAGGYLACGVALVYYYFWYVYAGSVDADAPDGETQAERRVVRRWFMEGPQAFMSSELRLPHYMRIGEEGEAHNA